MKTTLTLNDIYVMLSTLSDSDKLWLADKLNSDVDTKRKVKIKKRHGDISDAELASAIGSFPDLHDIPEADVQNIIKANSGKALNNFHKWI